MVVGAWDVARGGGKTGGWPAPATARTHPRLVHQRLALAEVAPKQAVANEHVPHVGPQVFGLRVAPAGAAANERHPAARGALGVVVHQPRRRRHSRGACLRIVGAGPGAGAGAGAAADAQAAVPVLVQARKALQHKTAAEQLRVLRGSTHTGSAKGGGGGGGRARRQPERRKGGMRTEPDLPGGGARGSNSGSTETARVKEGLVATGATGDCQRERESARCWCGRVCVDAPGCTPWRPRATTAAWRRGRRRATPKPAPGAW